MMEHTENSAQGFQFLEKQGDLFSCEETSSLAHCISADVKMGKGIAVIFKRKFQGEEEIKRQGQTPGGLAVLKRGKRFVYYLVTKEKYWNKPTYDTLRSSLINMRMHCTENKVKELCMPKIGCGLDGLQWPRVKEIIKEVFDDSDMKLTVYTL
ncbi:O-acetyl-ADP-ribose deacetylase 1 [Lingula anatina]|uniref:O-acetyl-ADP-ribose deacetylase 1 n=1 Tax=Lingula anatina TaxID=7574 RepID=A0A1S3JUL0_LINAN|nr:O-acetyl-ADP-ribose deacetylase 1 [Lingula anatina]|eukprot:XP_013414013.1 O-acetyl-ADP-ribose deacetylase 1 [Lingula anatina]